MSAFRFYISYPINNLEYSEFIEITSDLLENSAGNLKQQLSSNEYDIGTIKFNKISIVLDNQKGTYSEAINPVSIFTFKRDQTILRIDWDRNVDQADCGNCSPGFTFLSQPIEVYKGLLEDNSSKFDAENQTQTFNFLGLESIIGKTQVPFSSLSVSDDFNTTIFNILNQTEITKLLTVSQANINVGLNLVPDDIADLEDKKCLAALNDLMLLSGSVLYIEDATIFVKDRKESNDLKFTFYGPSSDRGIENLHDVSAYTLGENRTFNFFKWRDTSVRQSFQDSIDRFGFRDKEINSELITDSGKQTQILNYLLNEFGFPKKELDIVVPLTSEIVEQIYFLDKIKIDYPADYRVDETDDTISRYAQSKYGQARYLQAISSLIIDVNTDWKVLNRSVNIRNHTINLKVREV